jgi:prepilin-type N-terminal cleavage/methylation domain-containing protein
MTLSRTRRSGVTLVEILMALALLSLGLMFFGSFVTSLRSTQKAREQTSALAYARNYLETLKVKWQTLDNYQTLSLATPDSPPASYDIKVEVENDEGTVIFSYPGSSSGKDLSPLRKVTLSFIDEQDKTMSLVTLLARPTPVPTDEERDEE